MFLLIAQVVVALFLVVLVLLQSQNAGLGKAFGGMQYRSKKGVEKSFFVLTIALAVLFAGVSLMNTLL